MKTTPRERLVIGISGVVLLAALVGAVWMLQRARGIWSEESEAELRVELLQKRDALRGAVAEITALKRLAGLPSEFELSADLHSALQSTARGFQQDPLDGTENVGVFACIALELSGAADGVSVWTSGPIDPEDRTWCLSVISTGGADQGSRRIAAESHILGVAWSAFHVGDDVRVGALAWITPRSR